VDGGSTWTVTSTVAGGSAERWFSSGTTEGTASTGQTLVVVYYHQYLITGSYSLPGGGQPGAPHLRSTEAGAPFESALGLQELHFWLDSGTNWAATNPLNGSTSSHRWAAQNGTSGSVSAGLVVKPAYSEQFLVTLDFSINGGGVPGNVILDATTFGLRTSSKIANSGTAIWVDARSSLAVEPLTTASSRSERWATNSSESTVTASFAESVTFQHQYYLTVQTSAPGWTSVSPGIGWFRAGSTVRLNASTSQLGKFEGWIGSGTGSYSGPDAGAALALTGPVNETAVFYPGLEIKAASGGDVSYVAGQATGLVHAGASEVVYSPPGTPIVLTAQPGILHSFSGWSGSASGQEGTAILRISAPSQVSASFGLNLAELGAIIGGLVVFAAAIMLVRRRRGRAA
jgi:hypothetical protein